MRHPRKSNPSSMWQTLVFSTDRRKPIGASTVLVSSHSASASAWVPPTITTKSSAYAEFLVMPSWGLDRPWLLGLAAESSA